MNDLIKDYLGKAVAIAPNKKKIGHIVDRDPMDNSFLIFFSDSEMKWSKPDKLIFHPAKDLTVEIVDIDGDALGASPGIEKVGKKLIIGRLVYADSENTVENTLSTKIEFAEEDLTKLHDFFNQPENDPVNHPAHYTVGKYEVIDIIEDKLNLDEFKGYIQGNILKYLMRYKHKNGVTDLKKAEFYLKLLIEKESEGK